MGAALFAGAASPPATRPDKILPQNQQALLFFSVYRIAADAIAADGGVPQELHQKILDRIAKGRSDAEAMLSAARLPAEGAEAVLATGKLSQQVSSFTRETVRDIHKLLGEKKLSGAFDDRAHITMEEVMSLQVQRPGVDYTHRDIVNTLGLSEPQRQKMDALLKENAAEMRKITTTYVHKMNDGRGEYATTELALKNREAFRGILTAEQAKQWDQEILRRFGGK